MKYIIENLDTNLWKLYDSILVSNGFVYCESDFGNGEDNLVIFPETKTFSNYTSPKNEHEVLDAKKDYDKIVKIITNEDPILIGKFKAKDFTQEGFKVGCLFVSWEIFDKINNRRIKLCLK